MMITLLSSEDEFTVFCHSESLLGTVASSLPPRADDHLLLLLWLLQLPLLLLYKLVRCPPACAHSCALKTGLPFTNADESSMEKSG